MSHTHARARQAPDGIPGEQRPSRHPSLISTPGGTNGAEDANRPSGDSGSFVPIPGFPSLPLAPTAPIQPNVLHHARIATILYDAKVRPTQDAMVQFISDLATLYPAADVVASDLARHALVAGSSQFPTERTTPVLAPASRSIHLRRINVLSVARFTAIASFFMASMRLWLVVSLALAKCTASLSHMTDLAEAINRIIPHTVLRYTDIHFYDWIVQVVLHSDPLFAMQSPITFAGRQLNTSSYVSFMFVLPMMEAILYYIVGAITALLINLLLSLCNGLRVEGQDN